MRRALAVVALLVVAACGSTEPSSTPSPTPSPSSVSPTPTPSPTPGQSGGEIDASAPTTAAEAQALIAKTSSGVASPVATDTFVTPSGIYCAVGDGLLDGCELPGGGVPDTTYCAEAPIQRIGRIEVDDGTPTAVCNTDTIRTQDAAPTLGYGRVTSPDRPVQCVSLQVGVTCVLEGGKAGWFVSANSYRILS